MAQHKPEHALEYCLGCLSHGRKNTLSSKPGSSGFAPFSDPGGRFLFSMAKVLPDRPCCSYQRKADQNPERRFVIMSKESIDPGSIKRAQSGDDGIAGGTTERQCSQKLLARILQRSRGQNKRHNRKGRG